MLAFSSGIGKSGFENQGQEGIVLPQLTGEDKPCSFVSTPEPRAHLTLCNTDCIVEQLPVYVVAILTITLHAMDVAQLLPPKVQRPCSHSFLVRQNVQTRYLVESCIFGRNTAGYRDGETSLPSGTGVLYSVIFWHASSRQKRRPGCYERRGVVGPAKRQPVQNSTIHSVVSYATRILCSVSCRLRLCRTRVAHM